MTPGQMLVVWNPDRCIADLRGKTFPFHDVEASTGHLLVRSGRKLLWFKPSEMMPLDEWKLQRALKGLPV